MNYPQGQPVKLKKTEWLQENPIYQNDVCCPPFPAAELSLAQLHFHEFVEVSIVTGGSGTHCIWDRRLPCQKGDVYIVNTGVPHQYFSTDAADLLWVHNLLFDVGDWFSGPLADPDSPRFCYGVFEDNVLAAYAALGARPLEAATRLCRLMAQESAERAPGWTDLVQAYLTEFLVGIRRRIEAPRQEAPPQDARTAAAVMRQVMEHYGSRELTLEAIAGQLFLSKSRLSRVFYRVTGQHFAQYLRGVRLRHACELLRGSTLTNEQIVSACGLKDVPSFYRLFRTELGTTPYRYRMAAPGAPQAYQTIEKGETDMELLMEISQNLQRGKAKLVKEQVQQAVDAGIPVEQILNEGLLHGMGIIGEKFKNNEVYVPEVLVAARAMNMGAQVLKPLMAAAGVQAAGRVCIGTVQGDLHDIGKNLVKMMMEGKGLEVIDLGTDVAPETYVQTAIEKDCQIICCSALLTTTMEVMRQVVEKAEEAGIRDKVKIMIGGAPVTAEFCESIGADKYTPDAASAADAAVAFCRAAG